MKNYTLRPSSALPEIYLYHKPVGELVEDVVVVADDTGLGIGDLIEPVECIVKSQGLLIEQIGDRRQIAVVVVAVDDDLAPGTDVLIQTVQRVVETGCV